MSRVNEAVRNVNRDEFVLLENGSQIMQSTATDAIVSSLELLDIQPGNRVLEVGTGSGYSTALISYLVGSSGKVVSIDIDPELTQRASRLFENKGINNALFVTQDGRKGFSNEAPFDRIVAWATADHVPQAWIDQLQDHGVIVAPFLVGGIANSVYVCQIKKEGADLVGQQADFGGYILMNETPEYESYGLELAADVKEMKGSDVHAWASSFWLQKQTEDTRRKFLKEFTQQELERTTFGLTREQERGFRAYLFSQQKDGVTSAFRDQQTFIGYSNEHEFALLSRSQPLIVANGDTAKATLESWINEWIKLGKPSIEKMVPVVKQIDSKAVVKLEMLE